jgi:hypothetical protein
LNPASFRRELTTRADRVRDLAALVSRGYVRQWEELGRSPKGLINLQPTRVSIAAGGRRTVAIREWWVPSEPQAISSGCQYVLRAETEQEFIAFHRHQGRFASGHYHIGPAAGALSAPVDRAHIPAPGVTLEHFIEMLITDFGLRPLRPDWRAVLEASAT